MGKKGPWKSPKAGLSQWYKGLTERRTETTLLAGNGASLTELVGTEGDRYALVASFSSQSANELPPPPPGYQYESQELKKDFSSFASVMPISSLTRDIIFSAMIVVASSTDGARPGDSCPRRFLSAPLFTLLYLRWLGPLEHLRY